MSEEAVHRLAARLDDVEALLTRLSGELEDVAVGLETVGSATAGTRGSEEPVPEPQFTAVHEWVELVFTPTFVRTVGGDIRWCSRWSDHPEAVLRMEAMWRSWEVLRLDGGLGLSTWLLHHLDPGLAALASRSGPFARCSPDRHS